MHQPTLQRWAAPLAAAGLFALVAALELSDAAASGRDRLAVLCVVPTLLLARWRGRRAGLAGAALGLALLAAGAATARSAPGAAGLAVAAVVLAAAGAVGPARTRGADPGPASDSRWFEMSNAMLVEASLDGYFTRLSDGWERCLGWTRQELMERPFRELVHPDDLAPTNVHADALDARPGEVVSFENRYLAKDGSWRWLLWSARSDSRRKYAVASDITDRKVLEVERAELLRRVQELARTDALTGLPNRRAWDEALPRAVGEARRSGAPLAVAMVDLDGFKAYNDVSGHASGDRLLAEAAACWRRELREDDLLARYGGEEFAVLLPGCRPAHARSILERLRLATPGDQTCSVGLAQLGPGDGPDELLARADAALYRAKRRGRDRVVGADPT